MTHFDIATLNFAHAKCPLKTKRKVEEKEVEEKDRKTAVAHCCSHEGHMTSVGHCIRTSACVLIDVFVLFMKSTGI